MVSSTDIPKAIEIPAANSMPTKALIHKLDEDSFRLDKAHLPI